MAVLRGDSSDARVQQTSHQILNILTTCLLNKFNDADNRLEAGKASFLACIGKFVADGVAVQACLPAFPFKSANKVQKVLGILPDKAEELALQRLNDLCSQIEEIYPPGAKITIVSDGITYNGKKFI